MGEDPRHEEVPFVVKKGMIPAESHRTIEAPRVGGLVDVDMVDARPRNEVPFVVVVGTYSWIALELDDVSGVGRFHPCHDGPLMFLGHARPWLARRIVDGTELG